jgi:hypothetical protein
MASATVGPNIRYFGYGRPKHGLWSPKTRLPAVLEQANVRRKQMRPQRMSRYSKTTTLVGSE